MTTPCQYLRLFSLFISLFLLMAMASAQNPGDDPDGLILLDEVVGVSQGGGNMGNIIDNIPGDQRKGSLLVYNLYTSSASNPGAENTRINITNTSEKLPVAVHLFFIDGETCSVADSFVCLTANQTVALLASDVDPGVTGYLIAIAESRRGFSATFNALIGDAYIKMASGYFTNLPAIGFSEQSDSVILRKFLGVPPSSEKLLFIGRNSSGGYSRLPRVLALNSIPSRADGFETLLIINRIGGSLISGLDPIGNLFGFVFDGQENPYSFTAFANTCQLRIVLGDSFPRTAPRLSKLIPAAQTGWMKIWTTDIDQRPDVAGNPVSVDRGILGTVLYKNSVTGFSGGHNLHALSFTNGNPFVGVIEKPLFPTNCNLE